MKIVSEYRYKVTTLSVGGQRKTYTLTLQDDNLHKATLRAREVFESSYSSEIVVDVYCNNTEVIGGIK